MPGTNRIRSSSQLLPCSKNGCLMVELIHLLHPKYLSASGSYIGGARPISHYLLLPTFERGVADWHLDAIRPFINKYQPTIGFSPVEASHAKKVTVVGGASTIPNQSLMACWLLDASLSKSVEMA